MSNVGTVNISRSLFDHAAFKREPFTERESWVWLIMEASWKARQKRVGHAVISTERGQLATSIRFMAEAWGWTPAKAQRYLERLKKMEMICSKTDTGVSVITICNYDTFQGGIEATDTAAIQDRYSTDTNEKKGVIKKEKDTASFDEFWATFPKRPNMPSKAKVRPKFEATLKQISFDDLMTAVRAYAGSRDADIRKRGPQAAEFTKSADAWLNGGFYQLWLGEAPADIAAKNKQQEADLLAKTGGKKPAWMAA